MKSNLNQLSQEIHKAACAKGFWQKERELGTLLMLIVSEISEALEADRKSKWADLPQFELLQNINQQNHTIGKEEFDSVSFHNLVKDSFEDEIADVFIRLFDLCGHYGIDIDKHIDLKLKYNQQRPHKHGKEY